MVRATRVIGVVLGLAIGVAMADQVRAQEILPTQETEIELAGYADCMVSRRVYRARVHTFLRVIPDSEGFSEVAQKIAVMSCLNGAALPKGAREGAFLMEMTLQPAAFRDALYPALYRHDFGKRGPLPGIAAVAPLRLSSEFDGDIASLPPDYAIRRRFGDCVARAAPQGAHDLLTSWPHSHDADVAIDELKPALAICIAEGETVTLSQRALRAEIGEAMYKLSRAADTAASPPAQ